VQIGHQHLDAGPLECSVPGGGVVVVAVDEGAVDVEEDCSQTRHRPLLPTPAPGLHLRAAGDAEGMYIGLGTLIVIIILVLLLT
jgi:hypothetical protein